MIPITFPIRAVQVALALAVVAITSYLIHWYRLSSYWRVSPSEVNLLLFCAVWTLLLMPVLFLAALKVRRPWVIPSCEALTMSLWLASFAVLAVLHRRLRLCYGQICHIMVVAIVLGALECLLFLVTTVWALQAMFYRARMSTTNPNHKDHEMNPQGNAAV